MTESSNYSQSILFGSDEYFGSSLLDGSDEVKCIHCETCQKEGNSLDAEKYCTDCKEYLCGQCYKHHFKFKAFQHHKVQDVDALSPVITTGGKTGINKSIDKLAKLQIDDANVQQRKPKAQTSLPASRKVTAQQSTTINVNTRKDKTKSKIVGITVIKKDYCVVADENNKSVKVIDLKSTSVSSEIYLSEADHTECVTTVNDDQVAVCVTVKGVNKFLLFSVSASGVISNSHASMDVKYPYCCIVHSKDRFYGTYKCQIDVISMQGEIITTLTNDSFGWLFGMALSKDHTTIYVCSNSNDTVFSLNMDGKVKATYKHKDVSLPWRITVDGHGYVYVYFNCRGGRVYQLTADLNKAQEIVKDTGVSACTFNNNDNSLYLACMDEISVYNINFERESCMQS